MDLKAFNQLSCGLYLISSAHEGKESGCIVNTVQQVTAEPSSVGGDHQQKQLYRRIDCPVGGV